MLLNANHDSILVAWVEVRGMGPGGSLNLWRGKQFVLVVQSIRDEAVGRNAWNRVLQNIADNAAKLDGSHVL